MKERIRFYCTIIKSAFIDWWAKDPFKESAVIAYYAIFALPGLLIVLVTVAGYFFGQDAVSGQIAGEISFTLGADAALQVQHIIAKSAESKNSVWATMIGLITILVGATGVFLQFQKSLNTIWEVKTDESSTGILSLIKARLFSFGLIIAIAFILIVSLVISSAIAAVGSWVTYRISDSLFILIQITNYILSLGILALLFALMYKVFPDAKIKWRHVWIGSVVTAFLFEIGKHALGLYFGKADPGSGYGAAGSIILILLWVSYSSMIVFYGAEFTHAYAKLKDGKIPPDRDAIEY